jgi:hypothetical protein
MAEEHFSFETVQRFFRSELSRDENREFVRHLLRQCSQCTRLLQGVVQRQDFRFLIRALEEATSRLDPDSREKVLRKFQRLAEEEEARAGPERERGQSAAWRGLR